MAKKKKATKEEREALLKRIEEESAPELLAEADDSFMADREAVLAAVKEDGGALEYASEELQQDEELQKIAKGNLPSIDETETIEYTRDDKPVLGLIETELKRVLDRKAKPSIRELAGDRRFETNLSLTHYSNDKQVEGQPEVLLIHYDLGMETIEGDFKSDDQGNRIKTEWNDLWDRITDRFYGYDAEVGALLDMYEARDHLNEIDHDGFSGLDFQGFRELMTASSSPSDMWDKLQEEETTKRLASRPRAVSDDGPPYVAPEGFDISSKSVSEVIKAIIALYAAQNNLPSVDPDKIDDHDVIFELLDRNDPVTLTCRKAFDLTYDLLASVPEPVFITVGNAIKWYEELLADREVNPIGD